MVMSGSNWKWPELDDICWFNRNKTIEKIEAPKFEADLSIDSLTYSVPELNIIKNYNSSVN